MKAITKRWAQWRHNVWNARTVARRRALELYVESGDGDVYTKVKLEGALSEAVYCRIKYSVALGKTKS